MNDYEFDEYEIPDEDQVIEEFLGENPRARDLRLMRSALEQRRDAFAKDRDRARDERERTNLNAKVAELEKQIAALQQEEAITTFVEDSVRVTLHKPALHELDDEY